jgi:hypothetical protein
MMMFHTEILYSEIFKSLIMWWTRVRLDDDDDDDDDDMMMIWWWFAMGSSPYGPDAPRKKMSFLYA